MSATVVRKKHGSTQTTQKAQNPPQAQPQGLSDDSGGIPRRDPDSVRNFGDLYQALHDDFGMSREEAWRRLGVDSQQQMAESSAECYRMVRSQMEAEPQEGA